jgi:hypothetical protein
MGDKSMVKIEGEPFSPSENSSETEGVKPETKETEKEEWVFDEFKEFNIERDDLEKSKEFNELSRGQQYLVFENLRQLTLGRIQEEAQVKYREKTTEADFLGRLWKGISKKYQIAKLEKATAEQIKEGGWEVHGQTIEQLSKGMKEVGPEIEKDGRINYISEKDFGYSTPQIKKMIWEFNRTASRFSRIPYEWSLDSATKKQRGEFREAKENYNELKEAVLLEKARQTDAKEAALFINEKEKIIRFNQFLNSHPDVEKELEKITSKAAWARIFKDVVTERGLYALGGFLTRSATMSLLGAVGAPLGAAGVGGFRAWMRAKETLKEKEKFTRMGAKEKEKYFANADKINSKINTLISKLHSPSLDAKKQKTILKSLKAALEYGQGKLDRGLVNFGPREKRLANQYGLVSKLSEGAAWVDFDSLPEKHKQRIEKFFKFQKEKISKEKKKYLRQQITKGAVYGAAFAAAGYTIRYLWDDWFPKESYPSKEGVSETKPAEPVESVESGRVARMKMPPRPKEAGAPPEIKEPLPEELATPVERPVGEPVKPVEVPEEVKETVKEARELEPKIAEEAKGIKIREVKSRSLKDMIAEAREAEVKAAEVVPEAAKVEPFQIAEEVSIKRGDSIWSVAEKYLKGNGVYQELLENSDPDTAEALEAYNIDRIKDTIVAHPENYGLAKGVNLDKLTIEQLKEINWQKAFTDTFPEGRGLTTGLTDKQIESIIQNNDALKNFFAEHPNAPRTSENYEAILEGEGITGQPAGAPEEAEGMTEEAAAEKKLSLDEKKALLEKAGVPPEDIAKLETEDIGGLDSEQINEIAEVQQKINSLEKAGVPPEDIAKLETKDIKDLTQSQIEEIAGPAEITEAQLDKVRENLIDAYGMTDGESKAISGETIGNLLKNTPEDLDNIRDRFGPDLKLKHDGSFDYGEYRKYCKLAKDVRAVDPKPEEMDMTVGEFMSRKLSAGVEEAKKGAINIEL